MAKDGQVIYVVTADTGKYKEDLKGIEKNSESTGSKVGKAFAAVGKAIGAAFIAAGAAAVALSKKVIESYGAYEQLVGGVETLFGAGGQTLEQYAQSVGKTTAEVQSKYYDLQKAQKEVMTDAKNAYKDAGMSANQYMETVTGFSAALTQSLGGDTLKAAKLGKQAVIDMADNANKMGTSIGDIQNAYQGFAKQNYTIKSMSAA